MRQVSTAVVLSGVVAATVVTVLSAQAPPARASQRAVNFSADIKPVLEKSCWSCHSADLQLSSLDLSTREAALKGGDHGAAIVPGNAEASKVFRRIAGIEKPAMPMDGEPLNAAEVAAIKAWIDQGANWDGVAASDVKAPATAVNALAALERMDLTPEQRNYWFFKLPVQALVPVMASHELANPIDRFIEAKRQEKGLMAAPKAS